MRLLKAILLRLLYGVLSLLFITFVSFIADELAPGDAATVRAGEKASLQQIEQLRHDMGLDRPWTVRYVESLGNMTHGNFGESYYGVHEPVVDIIKRTLPVTMRLALLAIILASAIGITFGTLAAIYQNRFIDRTILTAGTLGVTIPNFVLGPLLVILFTKVLNDYLYGSFGFGIADSFQTSAEKPANWTMFVLPVIVLASRPAAMLTRLTRASMIETMQQEFIRMATAKGVPFWRLIIRHALRNAILPVITAIGTSVGFLLTGSFVTERFFLIPGLGQETIAAILQTNAPVFTGCIIVTGVLFLVVNLLVDLILPILDPRIREAQV